MESMILYFTFFCISLCFAALFAYLETSFTALRLYEVNQLESRIGRYKTLFATWRSNPQRLLITILIASNFADVLCSVLITEIMQKTFGGELGLAIGVFCATLLILFFGNILPKSFARTGAKGLGPITLWAVSMLLWLFYPIVSVCVMVADVFARRLHDGGEQHPVTEKEIEFLIDYSDQKGLMESDKTELLQNVFGLGQITVSSIMVPKTDMVFLPLNTTLEDAQKRFVQHRFTRMPVYEGTEENIIGFVYQKDLFSRLCQGSQGGLQELVRTVVFVPGTKKVNQLLKEFLKTRTHLAIIINEYGAVIGLVTLEDVLEEIVGEIRDEHEEINTQIISLENGEFLIDAKTELKKVEDLLGIKMIAEGSVTLGGFLSERLQHVPKKGERVIYKSHCFQIQKASMRKVQQVLVFKEEPLIT